MPTSTTKRQRSQRIKIDPSLYHLPPKVHIEQRNGSPRYYVRAYVDGKSRIKCTGEVTLGAAARKAEEIYLDWMIAKRAGNLPKLPGGPKPVPFAAAYESFIKRREAAGYQSPGQIQNYRDKYTLLKSELENVALTDIDTTWLETLRAKRKASTHVRSVTKTGKVVERVRKKPVSNSTLKKDFDFIRMVLKHARDFDKTLATVPTFPEFEGRVWKVEKNPRPFLPPGVWNNVKRAALKQASEPTNNTRTREQRQELYAFMMLCVGAALRPSEAYSLRWKDCRLGKLGKVECVHLMVHGKHAKHANTEKRERGWALNDGVVGFKYLQTVYPNPKPEDPLFKEEHPELLKKLLQSCNLREDVVSGMTRDAKSLRSTGMSLRLQEDSDPSYTDIAEWARTKPQHIFDFYDQVDPDWRMRRMVGGDDDLTPREKKSREDLKKLRKQMAKAEMMDNDDHMGEDQETGDEPWL